MRPRHLILEVMQCGQVLSRIVTKVGEGKDKVLITIMPK